MSSQVIDSYRYGISQHYSTDFSDTNGWSTPQTHVYIDTGNNRLIWDLTSSGTDEFLNYDLSDMDVSNEEWLLRWEMYFTTLNLNGVDNNNVIRTGLFSNASPSGIYPSGDTLGFGFYVNFGTTNVLQSINEGSETKVEGTIFSMSTSMDTPYYCELKRVSANSLEMRAFTTSDYSTTQYGSTMTVATSSAVNNTQYLTFNPFMQGAMSGSGYSGYMKNLDFWNGVTTPP